VRRRAAMRVVVNIIVAACCYYLCGITWSGLSHEMHAVEPQNVNYTGIALHCSSLRRMHELQVRPRDRNCSSKTDGSIMDSWGPRNCALVGAGSPSHSPTRRGILGSRTCTLFGMPDLPQSRYSQSYSLGGCKQSTYPV